MSVESIDSARRAKSDKPTGRVPPHNLGAEESLLGAVLLNRDVIGDVAEIVEAADFYKPTHGHIFDAVTALWAAGEPVDSQTVGDHLRRHGLFDEVGGIVALNTLQASTPSTTNAARYATIVKEHALLRDLIGAGGEIAELGYELPDDVAATIDAAEQRVYELTQRRRGGLVVRSTNEALRDWLDVIEARSASDGVPEIPTGWWDLDELLGGLHRSHLLIVGARPGMGKALALDTSLPTPSGWTTMGDVRVGDELVGANGRPTLVTRATEVMVGRPCYEVEFSDGAVIVADAEHQWLTETRRSRRGEARPAVVTTEALHRTLRCDTADSRLNHSVAVASPLQTPELLLPVDPYTLGAWLGDGTSSNGAFTSADPEIVDAVRLAGYRVTKSRSEPYGWHIHGIVRGLRSLGVVDNKHIPMAYLRSSEDQRRALLAGLLDTDGSIANEGKSVRFEITHQRLALDVQQLVLSLGYRCTYTTKRVAGRRPESSTCYRLTFAPRDKVFRLTRKASRQVLSGGSTGARRRYVTDVRPVPSVPVRCVQVDSEDHLYLAGTNWIPTHNTSFAGALTRRVAQEAALPVLFVSIEMSESELVGRMVAEVAHVDGSRLARGRLSERDWDAVNNAVGVVGHLPIDVVDEAGATLMTVRSAARRSTARHGRLGAIVIDYIQLMASHGRRRDENREREVAELARGCKVLAKDLRVPVVALAQLSRNLEMRRDKRPTLADLRESGDIENAADAVVFIYRDDYYNADSADRGTAEIIVAKNRHGAQGMARLAVDLRWGTWANMARAL